MERLYKKVSAETKENPTTLEAARQELVKLQSGDAENLRIWREMIALSQKQFDEIYSRLGVKFDHALGESFYNPRLKPLVDELLAKGIARESEGAIAIFFDDIPQLKEHPALIRKSDGGFNYTTTDLATLAYRLETWKPDEIIYVTDGRQQLHFQQVFAAFRKWQLASAKPELRNSKTGPRLVRLDFGRGRQAVQNAQRRDGEAGRFARRSGGASASKLFPKKIPELPEAQRREIARVVGLGAVKYADLLPNRQSDYVFSWDKMLALKATPRRICNTPTRGSKAFFGKRNAESRMQKSRIEIGCAGRNRAGEASVEFRADAGSGGGGISPEFSVQLSF